jgi:thiamine biosynthesis protein ThiI
VEALARVFGIQSLSLAVCRSAPDLATVVADGRAIFGESVRGRRFAVRARLVGRPAHSPFGARDIERALGAELLPRALRVDLGSPEVTARIEVHRGSAYYFHESRPGPGGLPLGREGRALALVSGGFDSAVAAFHLLRRGLRLDYLFCNLGGRSHELGVLRVLEVLARRWSYGTRPRLHAVDFGPVAAEIRAHAAPRLWQVLLKRCMLRAGEAVARKIGAEALVTGDSLGQVSSQTLANLVAVSDATSLPVLRPLVGLHKDEIIRTAEQIGTAALSAVVVEYCAMLPRRPATRTRAEDLRREEAGLDLAVLTRSVEARETLDLRSLDPEARGLPEILIDEIPDDALVIDLRSREEYAAWHFEGALHLDFARAREAWPSFAKERSYVLYCEFGLMSAHLAEQMRRGGLRAFHFRGGTKALRRYAERRSAT